MSMQGENNKIHVLLDVAREILVVEQQPDEHAAANGQPANFVPDAPNALPFIDPQPAMFPDLMLSWFYNGQVLHKYFMKYVGWFSGLDSNPW